MGEIVVVGSINTDLVFTCDRIPIAGETLTGKAFFVIPGGKGANQAVAAARLGAKVSMVGAVGNDANGSAMRLNLEENGVDTSYIKEVNDITGVAGIMVDQIDNNIVVIPGANQNVDVNMVREAYPLIDQAKVVLIQMEIAIDTVSHIVSYCYEKGITTILNPAPAQRLSESLIEKITYITPNELEVKEILGNNDVDTILKSYPNKMIVTQGEKGVKYYNGEKIVVIPSVRVDAVDTTGAGDTFNGAFASKIVLGCDLEDAIGFAVKAAAISVTKQGAQGGMPTQNELERWHLDDK